MTQIRSLRRATAVVRVDGRCRFQGSRCESCGATWFPQRTYCAQCRGTAVGPVLLAEAGEIYSYSVVHVGRAGAAVPYALATARFADDVTVFGRVEGWTNALEIGAIARAAEAPQDERTGDPWADYRLAVRRG
jgi:hypothetical protein